MPPTGLDSQTHRQEQGGDISEMTEEAGSRQKFLHLSPAMRGCPTVSGTRKHVQGRMVKKGGTYLQELRQGVQHLGGPDLQAFVPACGSLFVGDVAQVQDG